MTLALEKPRARKAPAKPIATVKAAKLERMSLVDFRKVYRATSDSRVQWIRQGVRAIELKDMVRLMDTSQDRVFKFLRLSAATINRKSLKDEALSTEDSERVVGMSNLIGQAQAMVDQSGNPDGFDAAKWVARWLEEPSPALGGQCPASYMDTMEGQKLVSHMLASMQSGAYA